MKEPDVTCHIRPFHTFISVYCWIIVVSFSTVPEVGACWCYKVETFDESPT